MKKGHFLFFFFFINQINSQSSAPNTFCMTPSWTNDLLRMTHANAQTNTHVLSLNPKQSSQNNQHTKKKNKRTNKKKKTEWGRWVSFVENNQHTYFFLINNLSEHLYNTVFFRVGLLVLSQALLHRVHQTSRVTRAVAVAVVSIKYHNWWQGKLKHCIDHRTTFSLQWGNEIDLDGGKIKTFNSPYTPLPSKEASNLKLPVLRLAHCFIWQCRHWWKLTCSNSKHQPDVPQRHFTWRIVMCVPLWH